MYILLTSHQYCVDSCLVIIDAIHTRISTYLDLLHTFANIDIILISYKLVIAITFNKQDFNFNIVAQVLQFFHLDQLSQVTYGNGGTESEMCSMIGWCIPHTEILKQRHEFCLYYNMPLFNALVCIKYIAKNTST